MIRSGAFYDQPKPTLSYPPAEIIVRHCNGPQAPPTGVKRWGSGLSRFNDAARVLAKYLAAGLQPDLSVSASIVL